MIDMTIKVHDAHSISNNLALIYVIVGLTFLAFGIVFIFLGRKN